jgi:hypothetical protein
VKSESNKAFIKAPLIFFIVTIIFASRSGQVAAQSDQGSSVGIQTEIKQIVIAGTEIEVRPLTECKIPVVVRITAVYPHGQSYRYDIAYYGLEAGSYDLRLALRRKDGTSLDSVPKIAVTVKAILEANRLRPNQPDSSEIGISGVYQRTLMAGATVWLIGLLVILYTGRAKRVEITEVEDKVVTLADRIRPLVRAALAGDISARDQAKLERVLLSYWRRKLAIDELSASDALAVMREHKEAGELLRRLEQWLHRPGPKDQINVDEFLQRYREVPDLGDPGEEEGDL